MSISDSFNINQANSSQSYAYKCWYNYNYGGNTMKISAADMGELTQTWNSQLANWKVSAEKDVNKYEISDEDFSGAVNSGKNLGKEKTGYSGNTGGMKARAITETLTSGAAAVVETAPVIAKSVGNAVKKVAAKITGKKAAETAGKEVAKEAATTTTKEVTKEAGKEVGKKAGEKAATQGAKEASKEGAKKASISTWATAALSIATTTAYLAKKPNKEQKEACDELQNQMTDAQASLTLAQSDMDTYRGEIEEMSDQAQAYNEDANGEIEDKKTEFDMYKASYDALMAKVNSGEELTEDEKNLLKELVPLMQELGVGIGDTVDETGDAVGEIFGEMETYQDGYDNAAATMGEVQGLTDYAESFDSATKSMCYLEGIAQGLNAANGATSGAKLCATAGLNIGQWVMGGLAIAAGATSGTVAVPQQLKWAGDVGTEIGLREAAQELNNTTIENYDESIDIYQGQMDTVGDLELEVPEDTEAPENIPVVQNSQSGNSGTPVGGVVGNNGTPAVQTSGNGTTVANNNADDKNKDKQQ